MKVCLVFESLLLKRALELFLRDKTTSLWNCDIVLSDHRVTSEKPVFLVGFNKECDIKTPFTQAKLFVALQKIEKSLQSEQTSHENFDNDALSLQIKELCDEFASKLIHLLKK